MNIRLGVRRVDGISVVWTHGEVNSDAVPAIQKQIDELLAFGQKKIIIDVSKAIYIDTYGLGLLIDIHEKCVEAGGDMTVVCTNNPKAYRNFKLLRLVKRFGVHEGIESALVMLKTER